MDLLKIIQEFISNKKNVCYVDRRTNQIHLEDFDANCLITVILIYEDAGYHNGANKFDMFGNDDCNCPIYDSEYNLEIIDVIVNDKSIKQGILDNSGQEGLDAISNSFTDEFLANMENEFYEYLRN